MFHHPCFIYLYIGFTNQEAVALLGGHTLGMYIIIGASGQEVIRLMTLCSYILFMTLFITGRAFSERTGVCSHSSGEQGGTRFTRMSSEPMVSLKCETGGKYD